MWDVLMTRTNDVLDGTHESRAKIRFNILRSTESPQLILIPRKEVRS